MAWITPPAFVALQTLTDSVMNQLSSRLSDLFPYTTIGDTAYASATDTLSRLGIGTAGQGSNVPGKPWLQQHHGASCSHERGYADDRYRPGVGLYRGADVGSDARVIWGSGCGWCSG